MKTNISIKNTAIAFVAMLAIMACNDEFKDELGEDVVAKLTFRQLYANSDYTFSYSATTFYNDVFAAGTGWKLSLGADWLTASPMQGPENSTAFEYNPAQVTFTISENPMAGDPRVAVSQLQATDPDWNYQIPITVSQGPASPYCNAVGETSINVSGGAAEFYISFETNDDWTIYLTQFNNINSWGWVDFEETRGNGSRTKLKGTVKANDYGTLRYTTIYVRSNTNSSVQATFYLHQSMPGMTIIQGNTLNVGNAAGQATLTLNSEAPWTASTSDNTWMTVSPTRGEAGKSDVTLTLTGNNTIYERVGEVFFNIGGNSVAVVTVRQQGSRLEVSNGSPSMTITSAAQTIEIPVASNTEWKAELATQPDWLTLRTTKGNGDGTITLAATDNPNTIGRTARLRVYAGESYNTSALSSDLTIVQYGKSIEVEPNRLDFGDDAGKQTVNVKAEGPWTATTSDDWISISPSRANATANMDVSVTENKNDEARNGQVSITMADRTLTLQVVQQGKMMLLDNSPMAFTSKGGTGELAFWTNDKWTAYIATDEETGQKPAWLTVSPTNGTDSAKVTVTVKKNDYLTERTANVVVEAAYGKKFAVPVTQAMRYLRANSQGFTFLGDGGSTGPLIISTDGAYSITNSHSWLQIVKDGNDSYTLTALPNTDGQQRTDVITVTCTDLADGEGPLQVEIPVRQVSNITDITITRYGEDGHWEVVKSDVLTVTLTHYATDGNWNNEVNNNNGLTISVTGYKGDNDWNKK